MLNADNYKPQYFKYAFEYVWVPMPLSQWPLTFELLLLLQRQYFYLVVLDWVAWLFFRYGLVHR